MPYLNIDPGFPEHRKTKRLVSTLGRGSEALLLRLWCYIANNHADTGRLTDYSPGEIESLAGWVGKPGQCIEAMKSLGWLGKDDQGWYVVNWLEHQGHIAAYRLKGKAMADARWKKARDEAAKLNAASMLPALLQAMPEPTDPTDPNQLRDRSSSIHAVPRAREAERPSEQEVLAYAQHIGLAEWKAKDWLQEMQSVGWLDYQHRPIANWQATLCRVRTKWEADGRPMGPPTAKGAPKPAEPRQMQESLKAKTL